MYMFRFLLLLIVFACAAFPIVVSAQNIKALGDIDRSVRPGDDFYWYANGGWLKTVAIPEGQSSFDTRAILKERTSQRVRSLIQEAAAVPGFEGSVSQKVGDYYASFMDQNSIEAKGFTPLAEEMAKISAITNKAVAVSLPGQHAEQRSGRSHRER